MSRDGPQQLARTRSGAIRPQPSWLGFNLLLVLIFATSDVHATPHRVEAGVIDLRDWDFASQSIVSLDGQWSLHWKTLLDTPNTTAEPTGYFTIPGSWKQYGLDDPEATQGMGYGTYTATIRLPDSVKSNKTPLGLYTSDVTCASHYRLYTASGTLLLEHNSGKVGQSAETEAPFALPQFGSFETEEDLVLHIQFSGYHHPRGSVWKAPEIGLAGPLYRQQRFAGQMDFFAMGITFIIGLYHLLWFLLIRNNPSPLWFSLFCFLITIRTALTGRHVYTMFPDTSDLYDLYGKVEYITLYGGLWLFLAFVNTLYASHFPQRLMRVLHILCACLTLLTIVTPMTVFAKPLVAFYILVLISSIGIIGSAIRAIQHDRDQTGILMIAGSLVLFVTVMSDMLVAEAHSGMPYLAQYGFLGFIGCQAAILAVVRRRMAHEIDRKNQALRSETTMRFKLEDDLESTENRLTVAHDELNHAQNLLIQAQKLSTLGELVASIGHELNNPLQSLGVTGSTMQNTVKDLRSFLYALIESDPEHEEIQEAIDDYLERLDRGFGMQAVAVRKMQDVSEALRNSSRSDMHPIAGVSVHDLVTESVILVEGKTTNIDVRLDLSSAAPAIRCHRSHIGQVVTNLVSNAADALEAERSKPANPDFKGEICITADHQSQHDVDGICIRVEDNGPGVPNELRTKVMQAFFTTKPSGVGTGLGLAICQRIVAHHQGTLTIDRSEDLGGAAFRLWVPVAPELSPLTADTEPVTSSAP